MPDRSRLRLGRAAAGLPQSQIKRRVWKRLSASKSAVPDDPLACTDDRLACTNDPPACTDDRWAPADDPLACTHGRYRPIDDPSAPPNGVCRPTEPPYIPTDDPSAPIPRAAAPAGHPRMTRRVPALAAAERPGWKEKMCIHLCLPVPRQKGTRGMKKDENSFPGGGRGTQRSCLTAWVTACLTCSQSVPSRLLGSNSSSASSK